MRILLNGYYGFGNAGDEWILEVLVKRLGGDLCVLSACPAETRRRFGVRAVHRWNPFSLLAALFSCRALVTGGGGLFQDRTGLSSLAYYAGLALAAGMIGRRSIVAFAGVGPVQTFLGRRLLRRTFSRADAAIVRDRTSLEWLRLCGVRVPVDLSADPVFEMEPPTPQKRAGLGLSLRPFPPECPLSRPEEVSRLIRLLSEIRPCVPILFHPSAERRLYGKEGEKEKEGGEREVMRIAAGCEALVTARYHGVVLAALCGLPCVGISLDGRLEEIFNQAGLPPPLPAPTATPEKIAEAASQALKKEADYRSRWEEFVARQRERLSRAWLTLEKSLSAR